MDHHNAIRVRDEGELDLSWYGSALLRRWRLVLATLLVVSVVGLLGSAYVGTRNPRYTAQATIVLTGPKYRLQLDPKFQTLDTASVLASRAEEFQAIASAPELRVAAAKRLATSTGSDNLAQTDVKVKSNVLTLIATSNNPANAAASANVLAAVIAERLDEVYGVGEADQTTLRKDLADAVARYDSSSAELARFTREDTTDSLNRELAQKESALATLASQQNAALGRRLASYYQLSNDLQAIRRDAESLRSQIRDAGQSAVSTAAQALALMNLQTRLAEAGSDRGGSRVAGSVGAAAQAPAAAGDAASGGSAAPVVSVDRQGGPSTPQLQVNLESVLTRGAGQQDMLRDVDAVIAQTRDRQTAADAEFRRTIDDLTQRVANNGRNLAAVDDRAQQLANQLSSDIQALRARLGEQQRRRDVLEQDIQLAKTARTTLETKLREGTVTSASSGRAVVTVAATPPAAPVEGQQWVKTIATVVVLGLLLGVAEALVLELWASRRRDARSDVSVDRAAPTWAASAPPVQTGSSTS